MQDHIQFYFHLWGKCSNITIPNFPVDQITKRSTTLRLIELSIIYCKYPLCVLFSIWISTSNAQALKLVSWNIQDFGKTTDVELIAELLRDADIVALQEIVAKDPGGVQSVAKLADVLDRMGSDWDYIYSDPTRSPSSHMSERYAFLWKTSKLQLRGDGILLNSLADEIYREPYFAVFEYDASEIYMLNYHSRKHNDNPEEEIKFIVDLVTKVHKDNWIIAGDFNTNENDIVFDPIYEAGFQAALQDQPTTLKRKCDNGEYLNHAIDNIYYKLKDFKMVTSGVIDFVEDCEDVGELRESYSDHLGVKIEIK